MTAAVASTGSRWTSMAGLFLAALGSAIGLGNIWRFSYVVGENGGGAFIAVYVVAVLALGLPLLIAELAVGRATAGNAVTAFERISARPPGRWVGWLGAAASIAILGYYPVIAGWVASYLWAYAAGDPMLLAGPNLTSRFETLIADPIRVLLWFAIVVGGAATIVAAGIERGIELASKILMPIFAVLMIVLAGYGLQLPAAGRAIEFLFAPDWHALLEPRTYLAAIGQAFFSIGLAMGILVTFGGYMKGSERLPRVALAIVAGDTCMALFAGIMIFPAVFSHGVDPAAGPMLAFVVLPEVFAALPSGRWIGTGFFALLLIAALTSIMALLEVPVSVLMSKLGWQRRRATVAVAAAVLLLGIPAALSHGIQREMFPNSAPLLDAIDHLSSNVILPSSGIAISLVAGWAWPGASAAEATGFTRAWLRRSWVWSLRTVIPTVIALAMIRGLGWI